MLDPLDSLRPNGPNAYTGGNLFAGGEFSELKWTDADFEEIEAGRMPNGEASVEWTKGDIDAAFSESDLVLEESNVHQSPTHHPMDPRSSMM